MDLKTLLINGFEGNTRVIRRLTDDMTHEESLIQPPFHANCLNWVLGHIVNSRARVQRALGLPPVWDEAQAARYATGSEPITGEGEGVLPLDRLLADLDAAAEAITAQLGALDGDALDAIPDGAEAPLGQQLHGLYWHESYHIGQLELLRALAGHEEKVFG